MIRVATVEDVPRIVEMGLRFLASSAYGHQLAQNADQIGVTAAAMIAHPDGEIFVAEAADQSLVGMIVVFIYPHPLSGERVAGELCWWVEPMARGRVSGARLLAHAEAWAVAQKADVFQMMAPTEAVGRIYEKRQYEKLETHYQRRLSHATRFTTNAA